MNCSIRNTFFFVFLIVLSSFLTWSNSVLADDPTADPPGGNTLPPVNVSGTSQSKTGGLGVGALSVAGGAQLGFTSAACDASVEGTVIYSAGTLQMCSDIEQLGQGTSSEYWTKTGSNIYYDQGGGGVSVNTTTLAPGTKLTVNGSMGADAYCNSVGTGCILAADIGRTPWAQGSGGILFYTLGNVGIGVETPANLLAVHVDSTTDEIPLAVRNDDSGAHAVGIELANSAQRSVIESERTATDPGTDIVLSTTNSLGALAEVMRLNEDGDVGIGDATPDNVKLDVQGKIGASEYCDQNGNNCVTADNLDSTHWTANGADIYFNGGNVGIGTTTPPNSLYTYLNFRTDGRHIYFGENQDLYGNGSAGLYFDSNSSSASWFALRDAENDYFGALYGFQGGYFGLLDDDDNWNYLHHVDDFTQLRIDNNTILSMASTGAVNIPTTASTTGTLTVGTTTLSTGLTIDAAGKIGATEYCNDDGTYCVPIETLGVGGGSSTSTVGRPLTIVDARLTASQAIPAASFTTITGYTESLDALSEFNNTTGVFTSRNGGKYLVNGTVQMSGGSDAALVRINKNGASTILDGGYQTDTVNVNNLGSHVSGVVQLDPGETLEMEAYFADATNAGSGRTRLSIVEVVDATGSLFAYDDGKLNYASGTVAVGTTSTTGVNALLVDGGIEIVDGTPATTTNALYALGDTLYWNGSEVGSGGTSSSTPLASGFQYSYSQSIPTTVFTTITAMTEEEESLQGGSTFSGGKLTVGVADAGWWIISADSYGAGTANDQSIALLVNGSSFGDVAGDANDGGTVVNVSGVVKLSAGDEVTMTVRQISGGTTAVSGHFQGARISGESSFTNGNGSEIYFIAEGGTALSVPNANLTTNVDFTEVSDTNNAYDGTTFTAPSTGLYHFESVVYGDGGTDIQDQFLALYKNGTLAVSGQRMRDTSDNERALAVAVSGTLYLTVGDTVNVRYFNDNVGGGSTTLNTSVHNRRLTGYKVNATSLSATTVTDLTITNDGLTLSSSTPATTTNALYALGDTLYWNGSEVGSGGTSSGSSSGIRIHSEQLSYGNVTCTGGVNLPGTTFTANAGDKIHVIASVQGRANTSGWWYNDLYFNGTRETSTGREAYLTWRGSNDLHYSTTATADGVQSLQVTATCGGGTTSISDGNTSELPNGGLTYYVVIGDDASGGTATSTEPSPVKSISFDGDSGGSVLDSHGASFTRTSTGIYVINWDEDFNSENYFITGSCDAHGSAGATFGIEDNVAGDVTVSQAKVTCRDGTNNYRDSDFVHVMAFEHGSITGNTDDGSGDGIEYYGGQTLLEGTITYHTITPTNHYPVVVPNETAAVKLGVYYLQGSAGLTHGYLSFRAYQRGQVNPNKMVYYYAIHYDDYYNSDWTTIDVPWDDDLPDEVTVEVLSSYNTNTSNYFNIYHSGHVVDRGGGSSGTSTDLWTQDGSDVYRLTGNVGIGENNPSQALHVDGNIQVDTGRHLYFGSQDLYGDNVNALYFDSNDSNNSQLIFRDAEDTTYGHLYGGADGLNFGLLDGDGNWAILHTKDSHSEWRINNSPEMRLTTSGLAVGTTTLSGSLALDVDGSVGATQFCDQDGGNCVLASNLGGGLWNENSSDIYFNTGNVAIGQTTANAELHVDGDIRLADANTGVLEQVRGLFLGWTTAYGVQFEHGLFSHDGAGYTDNILLNSYDDVRINIDSNNNDSDEEFVIGRHSTDNSSTLFVVKGTGYTGIGGITSPAEMLDVNGRAQATGFIQTSDESLKTNIEDIDDAQDLLDVRGVRYNWKEGGDAEYGFIAQEVEQVFPELVTTNPETGIKAVQYTNMNALLLELVKDQQEQISNLETRLEALENNN